jgi:AraC-like DNA-binding protein
VIPITNHVVQIQRPERSRVEIDDAADVDEFLEDVYGVTLRLRRQQCKKREGALLTHERVNVGPFAIDEVYLPGELSVAPDPLNQVIAMWASGGRVSAECDGKTSEAGAGEIALLSQPHLPYRAHAIDLRVTLLQLEPALVAGVASGLPPAQAPLPLRFSSFEPVSAAAADLWKRTFAYVRDSVLVDDTTATPLVLGHASRLLAAVTLSTFPNTAAAGPTPHDRTDHKPVLLRRAMQYMDANATNDIGLADIAEAVHVTPRAVQYMFRRHLETTPLQYLRRLRLHYAHQELLTADRTHSTVTEIAARWGFAHTGRFAVLYRATYGQSPHTTLRS